MDVSQLRTLIAGTALIDVEACRRELEHLRVLRGLSDAREVEVLTRLDELTVDGAAIFPEDELAKAGEVVVDQRRQDPSPQGCVCLCSRARRGAGRWCDDG